jgi:hypothetical protein
LGFLSFGFYRKLQGDFIKPDMLLLAVRALCFCDNDHLSTLASPPMPLSIWRGHSLGVAIEPQFSHFIHASGLQGKRHGLILVIEHGC